MPELMCTGMALVDCIIKGFDPEPVSASGFRAESSSLNAGGEAVNEAMAAAKLGVQTGILCALGNDGAGKLVCGAMTDCGVDTERILYPEEHSTPVTTMFVNPDGSRRSITNTSHRYNFHPELYLSSFDGCRAITLASLFRAPYDDPEILYQVVSFAKSRDIAVYADTKLPNFRKLVLSDFKESLPLIDYIFPNEDEARFFSGREAPEEMADVFIDAGVRNAIIKLGANGCFYRGAEGDMRLAAYDINPVDATGAGDNFIAGFIARKLEGADDKGALRFANACGAICTTAVGASAALKSRAQVERFMNENSLKG